MPHQPQDFATFSLPALDRAAHLRKDLAKLTANPKARAIVLWRGKLLVTTGDDMALMRLELSHPLLAEAPDAPVFLGLDGDRPLLAYDISDWEDPQADPDAMGQFIDATQNQHPLMGETQVFAELRGAMALLDPADANIAATARALMSWHHSNPHCTRCGGKTGASDAGWRRDCPSCNAQSFPRTDPVVIALITRGNEVLLGRSPSWPPAMYSLLAGFVEPGETIETATAREVFEEVGVTIGPVRYLASQPWPFPGSLMFGTAAEATSHEFTLDPVEIENAIWVGKARLMASMDGSDEALQPARKGSIARYLLEKWLKGEV